MKTSKNRSMMISYFIAAIALFCAGISMAQDRIVFGNLSTYAPPLDIYSSKVKLLNVGHYRQTTSYTCGPAAVMNLMYYYKMLGAKDMNHQTEMRISREMNASSDGTTEAQLVSWLGDHGFYVDSGIMVNSDFLIRNINKGYPVIIAYSSHWMLADGYENPGSAVNSYIIFSDTGSGNTRVNRDEIDSMWAVSKLLYRSSGNAGFYILAVPHNK